MDVSVAVQARVSIRKYENRAVPMSLIESVLASAGQAPSNCNTQPWHLAVVSGNAKDKLATNLTDAVVTGVKPTPDFPSGVEGLRGPTLKRQLSCAAAYYDALGIDRRDGTERDKVSLRNFSFFGAPHVAFLSMPKYLGPSNAMDAGIFLQTVMLRLTEEGIACCAQGSLALFPAIIKAVAQIPESNGILCGLAFGYESTSSAIARAPMLRENPKTYVTYVS